MTLELFEGGKIIYLIEVLEICYVFSGLTIVSVREKNLGV